MTKMQRFEKFIQEQEAQIHEVMKDVVSITPEIEIYSGKGLVFSERHFDGFPVNMTGLWIHRKDEKRWGINCERGWMWYDEEEVTVPDALKDILDLTKMVKKNYGIVEG